MQEKYTPENTVITVTGNIQHQEVLEVIDRLLGDWQITGAHCSYRLFREARESD